VKDGVASAAEQSCITMMMSSWQTTDQEHLITVSRRRHVDRHDPRLFTPSQRHRPPTDSIMTAPTTVEQQQWVAVVHPNRCLEASHYRSQAPQRSVDGRSVSWPTLSLSLSGDSAAGVVQAAGWWRWWCNMVSSN